MKKIFYLSFIALMALSFQSCVLLTKKQHNALLHEKDSLTAGWEAAKVKIISLKEEISRLKSDTSKLYGQISALQEELEDTKNQYTKLKSTYSAMIANSSFEIRKISDELNKREEKLKELEETLKKREERLREVEEALRKRDEAAEALKARLQEALLGFTKNGLAVELRNGKVYVLLTDKLLFPSGSIVIDKKGEEALTEFAKVMQTQNDIHIAIEGHTDNQKVINLGHIKDNWDLSVLRATSVARFLIDGQKIDPKRVVATGKGDTQPVDVANTSEARSKNRRIEIVLSPKLDELFNLIK